MVGYKNIYYIIRHEEMSFEDKYGYGLITHEFSYCSHWHVVDIILYVPC